MILLSTDPHMVKRSGLAAHTAEDQGLQTEVAIDVDRMDVSICPNSFCSVFVSSIPMDGHDC